jgi:hypothetical protein
MGLLSLSPQRIANSLFRIDLVPGIVAFFVALVLGINLLNRPLQEPNTRYEFDNLAFFIFLVFKYNRRDRLLQSARIAYLFAE